MDELDHLAAFRSDVAEPSTDTLASIRTRLDEQAVRPAVLTMRSRARRSHAAHPLRWRAATGLVAAAAVATGAFALTGGDPRPAGGPPRAGAPTAGPTSTAPNAQPSVAPKFVNAGQLLDAASASALKAGTPALGAGQYAYSHTHSYGVSSIDDPPASGAYEFSESITETWTPANPHELGYVRADNDISVQYPTKAQRDYAAAGPGGIPKRYVEWDVTKDGKDFFQAYPPLDAQPTELPCHGAGCADAAPVWDVPTAEGLAALPRDPAALRLALYKYAKSQYAELVKASKGDQFTVGDLAYDGATALLTSDLTPSDLRSALYEVAKTIPGIKLISSLKNYDGTRGIAIGRIDTFHVEHDLIFDPAGLTYIGDRSIARASSREYHVKAGTLIAYSAITTGVRGKPTLPPGSKLPS